MNKTVYLIQTLNGFQRWVDTSRNFSSLDECKALESVWRKNVPLGAFRLIHRTITDRVVEAEPLSVQIRNGDTIT